MKASVFSIERTGEGHVAFLIRPQVIGLQPGTNNKTILSIKSVRDRAATLLAGDNYAVPAE